MEIKSARFIISNTDVTKCPSGNLPEYAFIVTTTLPIVTMIVAAVYLKEPVTNKKGLAMTSSMPGKTQLINHFLINDAWYLVDLPGYGYAQRGKEGREKIRSIIESYILNRYEMTCLFVLIDCRHEPQKIDVEFLEWLGENEIPFCIVFTKADKFVVLSSVY